MHALTAASPVALILLPVEKFLCTVHTHNTVSTKSMSLQGG